MVHVDRMSHVKGCMYTLTLKNACMYMTNVESCAYVHNYC